MADSKSAEIDQLTERDAYHKQARAGNRIKQEMAALHMERQGLDQRKKELDRRYARLAEALELLEFAPLNIGKRELPERPQHLGLCCEIEMPSMPGTENQNPVEMKFDVLESDKFFGKGLHIDEWPASSIDQPMEIMGAVPYFQLDARDKFYPKTMKGPEWFNELNTGCAFPENTEGYWRQKAVRPSDETFEKLPWPVAVEVLYYDPVEFVQRLKELEEHSATEKKAYRGCTTHRWTGDNLGNSEYTRGPFRWPASYSVYLEAGVPPSKYFYRFVMREHEDVYASENNSSAFNLTYSALPTYQ